jgi:hypothetical protein
MSPTAGAEARPRELLRWSPSAPSDEHTEPSAEGDDEGDEAGVAEDREERGPADLPSTNGTGAHEHAAGTTMSDRAAELDSDHWRERAVIWRERAMAAELVAKMLQRNLDDLRANLEDLRQEVKAVSDAQKVPTATAGDALVLPPWRRFVQDLYDKYWR